MIPLSEKYRPKTFSEIRGQEIAVIKLKNFIYNFNRMLPRKNAVILHGPAGTGKTILTYALANENNYELFELNASDLRNRQKLDEVMKPSTLQKSIFAKGKIILVDEVDGVTSAEYGGLTELIALIENTKAPVIITANDIWQQKFSLLRQKCELVRLKEIPYIIILDVLNEIAEKEQKTAPYELIREIAAKSRGDLRAAINDLQSVLHIGAEIKEGEISEREKSRDIFNALRNVLKLKANPDTINVFDNVDMELDEIILWLEKNIPLEYRGKSLADAFDALSKADVFKGRIYRQQYWRFLTYRNFLMSVGVAAAKKSNFIPERFTKYEKPTRILKIWKANQKNARKKSIAAKYAEYTHISKKRALKDFFLIALVADNELAKKLNLSEQEKEFLTECKGAIKVAHGLNRFALEN